MSMLCAKSGILFLATVLLNAAALLTVAESDLLDGRASPSCVGDDEDADDDAFSEACEVVTSLLQTGSQVRMVRRIVGPDAAGPITSLLRLDSRRVNRTTSHSALLDADTMAKARALRGDVSGRLRYGPFGTERVRAYVGGYDGCGTHQYADVYYPVAKGESGEPGRVPLISFANGFLMGGPGVGSNHGSLLPFLTSWGFVIVAHESELHRDPSKSVTIAAVAQDRPDLLRQSHVEGQIPLFCTDSTADQIRSLEWASGSQIADRIDWAAPTGVAGYSMGGTATVFTASNAEAVSRLNIGAAFAIAPFFAELNAPTDDDDIWFPVDVPSVTHVPLFFATGALDPTCPPEELRAVFDAIEAAGESSAPRVFATLAAADHTQVLFHEAYHTYAAALFRCHLQSHSDSCRLLYGEATAPCDGSGPEACAVSDFTKFTDVTVQGDFD